MTRVHIVEKFNTSLGTTLITENNTVFKVGEKITCDDGNNYTIRGIQMGTRPTENSNVSLIVD